MRLDYTTAEQGEDDLLALADAVREPVTAAGARQSPTPLSAPENSSGVSRGHLRLLPD